MDITAPIEFEWDGEFGHPKGISGYRIELWHDPEYELDHWTLDVLRGEYWYIEAQGFQDDREKAVKEAENKMRHIIQERSKV